MDLWEASHERDLETIKRLLSEGGDFNKQNKLGRTALHLACFARHIQIIEALLNAPGNGVDPNISDKCGETPLHYAVRFRDLEMVKILLSHLSDPNITDSKNRSALYYAVSFGFSEIVIELLTASTGGINLNTIDLFGMTMLGISCAGNNFDISKQLLLFGADPNIGEKTPLYLARINNRSNTIQLLETYFPTLLSLSTKCMTQNKINISKIPERLFS